MLITETECNQNNKAPYWWGYYSILSYHNGLIIKSYKFSSANDAKRLRTTPLRLIVALPGKSLKRSTI